MLYREKNYMASLKLLVKISAAFNYHKKLPFTMDELLKHAKKILVKLQNNPTLFMEANVDYGIILLHLQRPDEALVYFDKVLNVDENFKKALLEKVESLKLLGYYDEAIDILKKSLERFPMDSYFLNNLGEILEKQANMDAAMDVYDISINLTTDNWLSYYYKGRILFHMEEYEDALPHFVEAIQKYNQEDFRVVDVYNYLGETLLELKRYNEAKEVFDEIIEIFPKRAEGYYYLGDFYFTIGKEREALRLINQAIRLAPPRSDYLYRKATYLLYMQFSEEALACLQDALELSPDDVHILDLMGDIYYNMGRYEDAIDVFEKRNEVQVLEITYYHLAMCYFKMDEFTTALEWINKYISMDDSYYPAYILRGKLNAHTNYIRLALNDLEKVLELSEGDVLLYDSDFYYLQNLNTEEEYHEFLRQIRPPLR